MRSDSSSSEQVSTETPSSALNVTLPAFDVARAPAPAQHGSHWAPAAIDRYLLPAGRSAANTLTAVVAVNRWDRRRTDTDGRSTAI